MDTRIILLVEDNEDDEALILRAFRKNEIYNEVAVARDGVEALDYVFATGPFATRDPHLQPTVILLDIKLPKLDGLDVLRRLRADRRTQSVPVVMLSSSNQGEDIAESYRLGANSYVRKPVDFAEFTQVVRRLADYWLGVNTGPPRPH